MKPGEPYAFELGIKIAAQLREFRLQRGLSVHGLAKQSQVSAQMIYNIEGLKSRPTLDFIALLCPALMMTLTIFMKTAEAR